MQRLFAEPVEDLQAALVHAFRAGAGCRRLDLLITHLQWQTWVRFAVWFVIGTGIYSGYSYRRSEPAGR